jgi:uncharacterized membrane protein
MAGFRGNARCARISLRLPILRVAVLCVPRCGAQRADTRRIGSLGAMRGQTNYAVYTRPCLCLGLCLCLFFSFFFIFVFVFLLVFFITIPWGKVCTNIVLHSNTAVNCVCNAHLNWHQLYALTWYSLGTKMLMHTLAAIKVLITNAMYCVCIATLANVLCLSVSWSLFKQSHRLKYVRTSYSIQTRQ